MMNDNDRTIVKGYILNLSKELNNKYPSFIKEDKQAELINKYLNSSVDRNTVIEEIKKEFASLVSKYKEGLSKSFRSGKELHKYNKIYTVYERIKNEIFGYNFKMYLAGGMTPYMLLQESSNRLHSDLDFVVDMKDMAEIRDYFLRKDEYNSEWDSLTYALDGNDYGFVMNVDGIPVGIFPFTYLRGKVTQYTFYPLQKECQIKTLEVPNVTNYVTTYKLKNGKTYDAVNLLVTLKSKIKLAREKDMADIETIHRLGITDEQVATVNDFQLVQKVSMKELDKKPIKSKYINAINRYSYIVTQKYKAKLDNNDVKGLLNKYLDSNPNIINVVRELDDHLQRYVLESKSNELQNTITALMQKNLGEAGMVSISAPKKDFSSDTPGLISETNNYLVVKDNDETIIKAKTKKVSSEEAVETETKLNNDGKLSIVLLSVIIVLLLLIVAGVAIFIIS